MAQAAFQVAHVSEIGPIHASEPGEAEWRPVRHHFGIEAFGVNAYEARLAGDQVVEEHTEAEGSGTGHEELYVVVSGHATFTIGGEDLEAPAGTFVFVPDPQTTRAARAREAGTTVLALGATPGKAFEVSPWERKYVDG